MRGLPSFLILTLDDIRTSRSGPKREVGHGRVGRQVLLSSVQFKAAWAVSDKRSPISHVPLTCQTTALLPHLSTHCTFVLFTHRTYLSILLPLSLLRLTVVRPRGVTTFSLLAVSALPCLESTRPAHLLRPIRFTFGSSYSRKIDMVQSIDILQHPSSL